MQNERALKRKRKLAEKRDRQTERARHAEYPRFFFETSEGDPRFVALVQEAVRKFDWDEIPEEQRILFRDMRKNGAQWVMDHLRIAQKKVVEKNPASYGGQLADILWGLTLGHVILSKIPQDKLEEFLPVNDVRFRYGHDIVVQFRSLIKVGTGKAAFYHSRRRPTIQVDGKKYVVAFSKHAIEGICDRLDRQWKTYAGLGDVYAWLEQNTYYETCKLLDWPLAFTFFDFCAKRFTSGQYVTKVLGEDEVKGSKGLPHYRLGYCPADLIDGQYIRARTLLFPGYSKTPEYGVLEAASLPEEEKDRLKQLAKNSDASTLAETGDFSAIKWFHDNGVPQVILLDTLSCPV